MLILNHEFLLETLLGRRDFSGVPVKPDHLALPILPLCLLSGVLVGTGLYAQDNLH